MSPQGQSWIVLASFQKDTALINAAFTRRKELRIELYLDSGDKTQNKDRFDQLLEKSAAFVAVVREPMKWERLEDKRACRVAVYTRAQILTDADSPALFDWAVKKAMDFHRAFAPEFPFV